MMRRYASGWRDQRVASRHSMATPPQHVTHREGGDDEAKAQPAEADKRVLGPDDAVAVPAKVGGVVQGRVVRVTGQGRELRGRRPALSSGLLHAHTAPVAGGAGRHTTKHQVCRQARAAAPPHTTITLNHDTRPTHTHTHTTAAPTPAHSPAHRRAMPPPHHRRHNTRRAADTHNTPRLAALR